MTEPSRGEQSGEGDLGSGSQAAGHGKPRMARMANSPQA